MSQWRNRIVGYGEERPDQLLASPFNFRRHPKNQQAALSGVLDEVGWIQNVVVNKTTGHMVDGHLRVELALRNDADMVPVTYIELSEADEKKALATFDPISALAYADAEQLKALLDDVSTGDAAVMAMLADLAQKEGVIPPDFDPNAEWGGMPEFHQEDQTAEFKCIVNFASIEDMESFERLIGQTIPRNTKSVWHPAQQRQNVRALAYVSDADDS